MLVPTAPAAHIAFDLAGWLASLSLGAALYRWRLKAAVETLALRTGPGYFAGLGLGAVAGAWLAGSLNTLNGPAPALSHSVIGALAGAIAGVEAYKAARRIHGSTGGIFVGPFALGVVIGRWGCLFAGLADGTFGTPTSLPWGVDLGDGVPRHPVQVYESLSMAAFLVVYLMALRRRSPWALRRAFYALCLAYGGQRFVWEFFKPYPVVLGPFNIFHGLCGGLVLYGLCFWRRDLALTHVRAAATQGGALSVSRPDDEPV